MGKSKFQAPTSKLQRSSKLQIPTAALRVEICSFSGVWSFPPGAPSYLPLPWLSQLDEFGVLLEWVEFGVLAGLGDEVGGLGVFFAAGGVEVGHALKGGDGFRGLAEGSLHG